LQHKEREDGKGRGMKLERANKRKEKQIRKKVMKKMNLPIDATITVLLISKISSTCFGQTFAYLQERKTEIFYNIWYNVL
jgi:hypothetical protein